ncbi:MAG TPA: coproporphyrinogen-III oxidase family protein [Candidatus Krumholzibacteria bacterium]|nr:coproporphyrinogen-III oxidase family protein [Candidatus Krumholzibacteria bacterium]
MRSLSLYIHVPFCTRRCSYCSFYHVPSEKSRERAFVDALLSEIDAALADLAPVSLRTIFVGGGTPTVLAYSEWERVVAALQPFMRDSLEEFTVEMNPEDVDANLARFLRGLGVSRASLGIQSMHPVGQKVLKRCDPATNERAIDIVMSAWDNVSFDVLLGVPKTTPADLAGTLRRLLVKGPKHLSVYGLEPGGDMADEVERFFRAVDPDRVADEYLEACRLLAGAGFDHYEVSNFARPGFESRHNAAYWDGREYLGVGPAAHSMVGGRRFRNDASIDAYASRSGAQHLAARAYDEGGDAKLEAAMLALRTKQGIAHELCDAVVLEEMVGEGLAIAEGNRVRLTDRGYLVLNDMVLKLSSVAPC